VYRAAVPHTLEVSMRRLNFGLHLVLFLGMASGITLALLAELAR
jgi:hypothetical protein